MASNKETLKAEVTVMQPKDKAGKYWMERALNSEARGQSRAEESKKLPEFEVLVDGGDKMKIVKVRHNGVYYRFQAVWSPKLNSFFSTQKYMSEGEEALAHGDMKWFVEQIESREQDSTPVDTTPDDIPFEVEA